MSETGFIILAIATFIAIFLAYRAGQQNILDRFEDYSKRRRERDQRWQEFEEGEE